MASSQKNLSHYDSQNVPDGSDFSFALVVSDWNKEVTEALFQGALKTLQKHRVKNSQIKRMNVPGSFELIYGAKKAQEGNPDVVIAIGSVIQGATKHFDFICHAVANGVKDLNIQSEVPVIFCVLTDNSLDQAQERSGGKHGNKGVEAAIAALQMAALRKAAL